MVRGMYAAEAITRLTFVRRDAAAPVAKLIKSAMASAEHNHKVEPEKLWISAINADSAGFIKRFRPRAMGRAAEIHKHMAHVSVTLSDDAKPAKKHGRKGGPTAATASTVLEPAVTTSNTK